MNLQAIEILIMKLKVFVIALFSILVLTACSSNDGGESYFKEGIKECEKGNYVNAVSLFRKSAEQKNSDAQYYLGLCYYDGWGVDVDVAEAVRWFRKSAEQGNIDAQLELGMSYFYGDGVEKNLVEAVKWYRKSAEHGGLEAQYLLGTCYYNGDGVEKNLVEAVKWYR